MDAAGASPDSNEDDDVHQVHPRQFRVAIAFGDSISCGALATGIMEDRHLSFSIGAGSEAHVTLPYLLQTVAGSPALKGVSGDERGGAGRSQMVKSEEDQRCWGRGAEDAAPRPSPCLNALNLAIPGATSNRWEEQMAYLKQNYDRFANPSKDPEWSPTAEWKVVTIFFGSNDLLLPSKVGAVPLQDLAQNFETNLDALLRELRLFLVKRVYVNLVGLFDMTSVARLQDQQLVYPWLRDNLAAFGGMMEPFVLPPGKSLAERRGARNRGLEPVFTALKAMNEAMERVAAAHDKPKEGFGVNMVNRASNLPITDSAMVGPVDCLHPGALAHRVLALGLFNAMLRKASDEERAAGLPEKWHRDWRFRRMPDLKPEVVSEATRVVTWSSPPPQG